jgi:hypothetical protein
MKFIEVKKNEHYPSIQILNKKKKDHWLTLYALTTQHYSIYLHGQMFIPELVICMEGKLLAS